MGTTDDEGSGMPKHIPLEHFSDKDSCYLYFAGEEGFISLYSSAVVYWLSTVIALVKNASYFDGGCMYLESPSTELL